MKHRQQWAAMLAKLVAPMDSERASKGLAGILPMLEAYPDGAFTLDSLEYVAARLQRVPTYSELNPLIGAWWKEHRPAHVAITHDRSDLNKIRREHDAAEASWKGITADQLRAKLREIAACPEAHRGTLGRTLATAVERHAPHLLGLMPPKFLEPTPERDRLGRPIITPKPSYVPRRRPEPANAP
jgi:hypothetical protein